MPAPAIYYGLNALSNNMIMADRKRLRTPNGVILGTPGSGKSFSAKREILSKSSCRVSGRIRSNREMNTFIQTLLDLKNRQQGERFTYENVDVLYAANTLEAERIIRFYQKERGYTFIEYDEPLVDCPGDINVLEAAGMEFDNVIITLTSHFRYNEDGVLQGNAHPNPDYSYYRLLFQSVSRTRERLCIVVIGDETLFAKVLSIQQY